MKWIVVWSYGKGLVCHVFFENEDAVHLMAANLRIQNKMNYRIIKPLKQ